jgi:hypothetical protein
VTILILERWHGTLKSRSLGLNKHSRIDSIIAGIASVSNFGFEKVFARKFVEMGIRKSAAMKRIIEEHKKFEEQKDNYQLNNDETRGNIFYVHKLSEKITHTVTIVPEKDMMCSKSDCKLHCKG